MSLESFISAIQEVSPNTHLANGEAEEARRNLSSFVALLVKINEREQVVPTRALVEHKNEH